MTAYFTDNIPGWMEPEQLDWLAEQASKSSVVVEIGIWRGRSTHRICSNCPGVVFSIDSWRPAPDCGQYKDPQNARTDAFVNLKPFLDSGKLFIIEARSITALEYVKVVLEHHPPDWAFIDGDHNPWVVKDEIDRLKWMGTKFISGHDYDEVRKGLPETGVGRGPGSIWYLEGEHKLDGGCEEWT